ncbi:LOG family protein [Patescibacteria group bacterium]
MEDKYKEGPFIRNIAFFGDANVSSKDPTYKAAYETAKLVAQNGYAVVDGGGPGVMQAATSGAQDGGGATLTVTFDPIDAPGYEGRYLKNVPDKEVITTNYIDRMFKLMEYGDIFVIFKGGSGTISEFGAAWVLAKIYYGNHKPFILYGNFWAEIIDILRKNMNLDKSELSVFEIVEKPQEVLNAIKKFEAKKKSNEK